MPVTISGSGLSGATVSAGTGITATVSNTTSSQVTATFAIAANAPPGNHIVTVSAGNPAQTSNSLNFFVQVPTYFQATSMGAVTSDCDQNSSGQEASVQYQVLDQSGVSISTSGLTPRERFTVDGTLAFPDFRPFATPQTTSATGGFTDVPVGTCYGTFSGNPCVDVVQTFDLLNGTQNFSISTTTTRKDCRLGLSLQQSGNPVNKNGSFSVGTVN